MARFPRRTAARGLVTALLGTVAALPVAAQTINYGELRTLFGEPVTTSATGKPQRVSDAPVTMEIISDEEIRRSGAQDLPEILRRVSSMAVTRVDAQAADVNVRGYNQQYSSRLLVLVNGRQVYNDHFGMTAWAGIPVQPEEIQQVEVVKGPNTALFGFNAVSGVVNIVTKSPIYDDVNSGTLRLGADGIRSFSGVATIKLGDLGGVRVSAGASKQNQFSANSRLTDFREVAVRQNPDRTSLSVDGLFQVRENIQAGFEVTQNEINQYEAVPAIILFNSDYKFNSAKGSVTADLNGDLASLVVYKNWLDQTAVHPLFTRNTIEQDVLVAQAAYVANLSPKHTVRGSVEFRANDQNTQPARLGRVKYKVYSGGAMWDWQVDKSLSFTAAARGDYFTMRRTGDTFPNFPFRNEDYDRKIFEWSYNAVLVYRLSQDDTLRLAAARGVQLPSLIEYAFLDQVIGATQRTGRSGDPNLDPTIVDSVELGWDRAISAINGRFRAAAYYQWHTDLRTSASGFDPDFINRTLTPPLNMQLQKQAGDSKAYGFEASVDGMMFDALSWGLRYGFISVEDELTVNPNRQRPGRPIDFQDSTPNHQISALLGYSAGPFTADLQAHYYDKYDGLRFLLPASVTNFVKADIGSFVIVNARVAYRIGDHVELSADILNAQQSTTRVAQYPEQERRYSFGLRVDF